MTIDRSAAPIVLHVTGETSQRLFGLTPRERLHRQFARAGVPHVDGIEAAANSDVVCIAHGSAVIDQPLVQLLAEGKPRILLDEAENTPLLICCAGSQASRAAAVLAGTVAIEELRLPATAPAGLKADFWKALRKKETPYALRLTAGAAAAVEWRMFMGTYKGATDLVTKHLWPRPAFHVTRMIAPLGITPNMVTALGAAMTVLAFWLFLQGHFASGLLAAWAMTFLDTVDGKLARATLTSSKWGDVFDHGIDLVHPPFWYIAWALGLARSGFEWSSAMFWWVNGAILGGYILQRVMEGIAIKWLGLEIHIWRPIDTLFRQVTARRNPNLIILSLATLAGRPDIGLIAVAVWTVVCLVLHGLQLVQALAATRQQGKLVSWMMRS